MAKSYKTDKAHLVFSDLKNPDTPHPIHSDDYSKMWDWMTCGRRHGNNRNTFAVLKRKIAKQRRAKANTTLRREIAMALQADSN